MSVRETLGESPRDPDRKIGRYEIRGQIGRGGFGAVYRALDPQLQRDVALKILMRASPKARQRFNREVQAVARLRHPHIVSIHDSGEESGRPYLVMEFIDGATLEELVREGRADLRTRITWVRDVARAIQYAHDQGVLHRDIKPENVLVDRHEVAHVLDFGLAFLEEESGLQRLSISGIPMGTPAYMAPEQAAGRRPDHRTDVWGLGGVLYFALVGEGPYERFNNPLIAVQNEPVRAPRELDPELSVGLERICLRCLAKPPEERYESPRELADALTDWLERGDTVRFDGKAGQAALALIGIAGAVLVGVAVFAFARSRQPRPISSPPQVVEATPSPSPSQHATTPTPSPVQTPTPASPRAREVERTLARARELGAKLLDSSMVLGQLEQAARQAGDDRDLAEAVALATFRHHLRRAEFDAATAALESFAWKTAGLADRLRLELYLAMEDEPRARKMLPRLSQGEPDAVGTILAKAWKQLLEEQDPDAALYSGRRAVELEPDDVAALMFVARLYLLRDEPRRALEFLERAREAAPDDHRPLTVLALLVQELDPRASLQIYDDLIHLLGERAKPTHYASRGVMRSRLGDAAGADADLQEALKRDPEDFTANLALGLRRLQRDEPEQARDFLVRANAAEPEAFRLQLVSLPSAVSDTIRELVGLDDASRPLNATLRELLRLRAAQVEAPAAREALQEALERAARGRPWADVLERLDAAAAAAPDSKPLLLERLRLSVRRDAYPVAEAALRRARELGLLQVELDMLEAELYGRRGQFQIATELYEQVIREAPETTLGLTARATVLMLESRWDEALGTARESLELDPTQTAARVMEALCLGQLASPQVGRRQAEIAIDTFGLIDSRLPQARFRFKLVEVGVRIQQRGEPLRPAQVAGLEEDCAALAALTEGPEPRLMLASFLLSYPSPDGVARAKQLLNEVASRHPDSPGLSLQRFRLAVAQGDRPLAEASAIRAIEAGAMPPSVLDEFERAFGEPFEHPPRGRSSDDGEGGAGQGEGVQGDGAGS